MKKLTEEAGHLLVMCIDRAQALYGKDLPKRIEKRIVDEVDILNDLGLEDEYLILAKMMDTAAPEPLGRLNVGVRDGAGSLFVSYLCGLSAYNPIEYMGAGLYPELYHAVLKGRAVNGIKPSVSLDVSRRIYDNLLSLSTVFPEQAFVLPSETLTLLDILDEGTVDHYFPVIDEDDGFDDKDQGNVRKALGESSLFWEYVPLVKDNHIVRTLSGAYGINKINTLSKIIGIAMGTGTWTGNIEPYVLNRVEAGRGFDIGGDKFISCLEDIYDYLERSGLLVDFVYGESDNCKAFDKQTAWNISLRARIGACSKNDIKMRGFWHDGG